MKPVMLIVNDGREVPEDIMASWVRVIDPKGLYEIRRINALEKPVKYMHAKLRKLRSDVIFLDVRLADVVITLGKLSSQLVSDVRGDYLRLPHPSRPVETGFNERIISVAEEVASRYSITKGGKRETIRADGRTYYC